MYLLTFVGAYALHFTVVKETVGQDTYNATLEYVYKNILILSCLQQSTPSYDQNTPPQPNPQRPVE
jgi:hypothetical protein